MTRVGEPTPGSIGYLAMKMYEAMNSPENDDWEDLDQSHRNHYVNLITVARNVLAGDQPVPMLLICPNPWCSMRHIDEGEFATKIHHTHACQFCGMVWRPALVPTIGVQFLPGFRDD